MALFQFCSVTNKRNISSKVFLYYPVFISLRWIYLQQTRIALEFLLLSSIRTMKTPYGQTRGLYVYVANKSIHRFRVQKTTCNHYANFFADVKVIGQLFSQNSLNESLLFYNFSVKTIRMKVCYFTLLQLKRLWENIAKYLILSCTCFCSIPC